MAGHSKWHNIKHKKERSDAQKNKVFTKLSRAITAAVKSGGPNEADNSTLAEAIASAKASNMPKDNIERAIEAGAGQGAADEHIVYEGSIPGGVLVMVECLTDSTNRTVKEVKSILTRSGGHLLNPGGAAFAFEMRGEVAVRAERSAEEQLLERALEAGADDVEWPLAISDEAAHHHHHDWEDIPPEKRAHDKHHKDQDHLTDSDHIAVVVCAPDQLMQVAGSLEAAGCEVVGVERARHPTSVVEVDAEHLPTVDGVLEALEEHDDVQKLYHNGDW